MPAALYGIELTSGCPSAVKALQAAIANVIGSRAAKRSQLGSFEVQKKMKDLDPEVVILVRRATLFRRQLDKFPNFEKKVKDIIQRYEEVDCICPELDFEDEDDEGIKLRRAGPVGFLIDNLGEVKAKLNGNLEIEHDEEQTISLKHTPWQKLKEDVQELAKKSRCIKAASERKCYSELKEVDSSALKAALSKRTPEEIHIIRHNASLATWTEQRKQEVGLQEENVCKLCKQVEDDPSHSQWRCLAVHEERKDTYLKQVHPDDLPMHLQFGLPGAMCKEIHCTFWGKPKAQAKTRDDTAKSKLGLPKDNKEWVRRESQNQEAELIYQSKGIKAELLNA